MRLITRLLCLLVLVLGLGLLACSEEGSTPPPFADGTVQDGGGVEGGVDQGPVGDQGGGG